MGIGNFTQTFKQTNKQCIEKQEGTKYIIRFMFQGW